MTAAQSSGIRGVKTNIPFLLKLVKSSDVLAGESDDAIDDHTPRFSN